MGELTKKVTTGHSDETPRQLDTPGKRALYNNLRSSPSRQFAEEAGVYAVDGDPALILALKIDETVKRVKPDDFRGYKAKENIIKAALLPLLRNDEAEVERIFKIIFQQHEY
jgi:type I restriction enzyme R subunit